MIGPTNRKSWFTFGGAPIPDTDSGSLFHFPHRCGGDFRRFISISHAVTISDFFTKLGEMNPQHFGRDPPDIRIRIRINPTIRIRIPDHFWLKFWRWRRFALSEHSLVLRIIIIIIVNWVNTGLTIFSMYRKPLVG